MDEGIKPTLDIGMRLLSEPRDRLIRSFDFWLRIMCQFGNYSDDFETCKYNIRASLLAASVWLIAFTDTDRLLDIARVTVSERKMV